MSTAGETSGLSRRVLVLRSAGWAVFILAVAWVVLVGGGYAGIEFGLLRQISLALIGTGLLAWAVLAWRWPSWRPRSSIWPALLVPYAVLLAATLTSSLPRLAVDYLAWATLLIALYLMLVRVLGLAYVRERIGGLMAMLGFVVSIAYIGLVAARWLQWWDLIGHFEPPMLRPAYAGLFVGGPTVVPVVVVLLMVGASAGLGLGTRGRQVTIVILAITSLCAVFLSGTRGSWLALAVAFAVVGVGAAVHGRVRLLSLVRERRIQIGLAIVAVGLAAVGSVMVPALLTRLEASGDGGRSYYVATAQRMFADAPLLGHGPGTWPALRIAYSEPGEPDIYVPHPHNTYALTLAETGLMGAAAGAIALIAVLWLAGTGLRGGDAVRRRWSIATIFVLVYLGVASILDSYANLPVVLLLAALPVAVLDATSPRGITDRLWTRHGVTRHRLRAIATVALFGAVVLAGLALWRIESLAASHQRAVAAIEEGDWDSALPAAETAVVGDPQMIPYQVTYGIAAAARGEWERAAAAFEVAAEADDLPESWLNLAQARLESGQPRASIIAAIDLANRLRDDDPFVLLGTAALYERMGMDAEATESLIRLLTANPSLAGDDVWTEDPAFASRFSEVYQAALRRARDPWRIPMMAGDFDLARRLSAESQNPLASIVVEAWAGDSGSLATLGQMAVDSPRGEATAWAARAYANPGNGDQADRFRAISVFGHEGAGLPGYELRVIGADRSPPEGALDMAHGYGKNDYRRGTPGHLVAPGMPTLVLADLAARGAASG